jgi:predicted transcriptional regulator
VVSIRNSVTPDYLICLDDGRKFKSLRRHLALLGMTPEQYRRKWNLPADYPMVAPRERGIVNPGKRLLAIHLMRTSTPRSN